MGGKEEVKALIATIYLAMQGSTLMCVGVSRTGDGWYHVRITDKQNPSDTTSVITDSYLIRLGRCGELP